MLTNVKDEVLWVEKYRPQKVSEAILPVAIKKQLQEYVDKDFIPNLIMSGGPGVGKTTAAMAMFNEMGIDFFFINGSLKGGIDTLRTEISEFASSVSFTGKRKYVLLDEADYLNANSTQPALRGFMEEFSKNCGFILTCNYSARLIPALHSRCSSIEFVASSDEQAELCYEFFGRAMEILKAEGVSVQPELLGEIITKHFPDWRKVLNVLQGSVKDGKISNNSLVSISQTEMHKAFKLLKEQSFSKIREWCAIHGQEHPKDVFSSMYAISDGYLKPPGQAQLALTINKYEYHAAFVANQEINLIAAMVEIMTECEGEFK